MVKTSFIPRFFYICTKIDLTMKNSMDSKERKFWNDFCFMAENFSRHFLISKALITCLAYKGELSVYSPVELRNALMEGTAGSLLYASDIGGVCLKPDASDESVMLLSGVKRLLENGGKTDEEVEILSREDWRFAKWLVSRESDWIRKYYLDIQDTLNPFNHTKDNVLSLYLCRMLREILDTKEATNVFAAQSELMPFLPMLNGRNGKCAYLKPKNVEFSLYMEMLNACGESNPICLTPEYRPGGLVRFLMKNVGYEAYGDYEGFLTGHLCTRVSKDLSCVADHGTYILCLSLDLLLERYAKVRRDLFETGLITDVVLCHGIWSSVLILVFEAGRKKGRRGVRFVNLLSENPSDVLDNGCTLYAKEFRKNSRVVSMAEVGKNDFCLNPNAYVPILNLDDEFDGEVRYMPLSSVSSVVEETESPSEPYRLIRDLPVGLHPYGLRISARDAGLSDIQLPVYHLKGDCIIIPAGYIDSDRCPVYFDGCSGDAYLFAKDVIVLDVDRSRIYPRYLQYCFVNLQVMRQLSRDMLRGFATDEDWRTLFMDTRVLCVEGDSRRNLSFQRGYYERMKAAHLREVISDSGSDPDTMNICLQPGTRLQNGRYEIIRMIGRGGFAIIYLARMTLSSGDVEMTREVALKEFFPHQYCKRRNFGNEVIIDADVNQAEVIERTRHSFFREAENQRKLSCLTENIVHTYQVFEENGTVYYSMDYIKGKTISELVSEEGPLGEEEAGRFASQVASALGISHENMNLSHLDVSPNNIVITEDRSKALLIDFGNARHYDSWSGMATTMAYTAFTPGYSAPELHTGMADTEQMSTGFDMFGLAATLRYMLTAVNPMPGECYTFEDLKRESPVDPSLSEGLQKAIVRGMQADPSLRPADMREFLSLLAERKDTLRRILGRKPERTRRVPGSMIRSFE